jgi:hypothetical protein
MEHWWNDTDRGKLSVEHWCNDNDKGKLNRNVGGMILTGEY